MGEVLSNWYIAVVWQAVAMAGELRWPSDWDASAWSAVAEWVAGIGTLIAVVVALVTAALAGKEQRDLARRQARTDEAEESARFRAQADRVCAWYSGRVEANHGRGWDETVAVVNDSTLPVHDLAIEVGNYTDGEKPGATLVYYLGVPLGPGQTWIEPTGIVLKHDTVGRAMPPSVILTFRDASGTWWERAPGGALDTLDGRPHFWSDEYRGKSNEARGRVSNMSAQLRSR